LRTFLLLLLFLAYCCNDVCHGVVVVASSTSSLGFRGHQLLTCTHGGKNG